MSKLQNLNVIVIKMDKILKPPKPGFFFSVKNWVQIIIPWF